MQSVTIATQEDIYIALSAEWSLSILRYIFFLFISKTTLKRRQNILNDELNIHITYIFDDFLWNSNLLYFILTIYGYIFIYWEWLINICFVSILIGFPAVDWNRKHCTKLTLLLCTRLSLRELFRVSFFISNKRGIVFYFLWIDGETNNLS